MFDSDEEQELAKKYRKMAQETLRSERSNIAMKAYKKQIKNNLIGDTLKIGVIGFCGYILYRMFGDTPVRRNPNAPRLETGLDRYPPPPPGAF